MEDIGVYVNDGDGTRKRLQPIIAAVLLQLNASEGERLLSPTEIKSDAEDATNFIDVNKQENGSTYLPVPINRLGWRNI
eukprot:scaffold42265_cov2394-Skeletonema_marinoi.AAC.1